MNDAKKEIAVGVITELTKDGIKALVSKIKSYLHDMDEKMEIDFNVAYEKYLTTSYEKIHMVKTLIYKKEPRDLYTIYECMDVRYNGNEISTENVNNILDIGHKLIITGIAGMGKTTMLKHLFINSMLETDYIRMIFWTT